MAWGAGLWVDSSGIDSWPGHCVVFLVKILYSHEVLLFIQEYREVLLIVVSCFEKRGKVRAVCRNIRATNFVSFYKAICYTVIG